jgi:hypothetical protein
MSSSTRQLVRDVGIFVLLVMSAAAIILAAVSG